MIVKVILAIFTRASAQHIDCCYRVCVCAPGMEQSQRAAVQIDLRARNMPCRWHGDVLRPESEELLACRFGRLVLVGRTWPPFACERTRLPIVRVRAHRSCPGTSTRLRAQVSKLTLGSVRFSGMAEPKLGENMTPTCWCPPKLFWLAVAHKLTAS